MKRLFRQIRLRRKRDVVFLAMWWSSYGTLQVWLLPNGSYVSAVIGVVMLIFTGWYGCRIWDRAGDVNRSQVLLRFTCPNDSCAVTYTHVEPKRVYMHGRKHMASVHLMEWSGDGVAEL